MHKQTHGFLDIKALPAENLVTSLQLVSHQFIKLFLFTFFLLCSANFTINMSFPFDLCTVRVKHLLNC